MSFNPYTKLQRTYARMRAHEKFLVWLLCIGLTIGTIWLVGTLQTRVSTEVPTRGGTYAEGIVGFPRYINPVLANTHPDKSVTKLVYAGLMKRSPDGEIVPDLATSMSASADQTVYTFNIDPNAEFHDGHPVRAEDVVFTIEMIQDPQVNSPKQAQWQDVSVTAVNDTTVRFELSQAFAGLPANATVGILPRHLWQAESSQSFAFSELNTNPVGAGPFAVTNVSRSADGIPTNIRLHSFEQYVGGRPHINTVITRFFPDHQRRRRAYETGQIEGMPSVDPAVANRLSERGHRVTTHQFNRVFSVFFNDDQNETLVDKSVRKALTAAVPKSQIVDTAVAGYGQPVSGPLPPALSSDEPSSQSTTSPATLLSSAGWELNDGVRQQNGQALSLTLTTSDIPALSKAANMIANSWRELGVEVSVQTLPTSQLTRNVLRPRDFETLLFGQSISSQRDLYSFWHSSRQEDPGLNFAQYTNMSADNSLEALRSATSTQHITELTNNFLAEIKEDQPAAFVFSPSFIYVLPEELGNVRVPPVTQPTDRFANISNWYTDTDMLWNVFVDEADQR